MWLIVLLMIMGMLLLMVEIVLLPGVSIAAFGAIISYGLAIYRSYVLYGTTGLIISIIAVLILVIVTLVICLNNKTWNKFSLKDNIDGKSQKNPQDEDIKIGDKGITLTRLAPIGKVNINGRSFEAKSVDDFMDPKTEVEVTGFDNFSIVVKRVE